MSKKTWFTKKMETYSRATQEMIARTSCGKGEEHFNQVMEIIKQAKTEQEVQRATSNDEVRHN